MREVTAPSANTKRLPWTCTQCQQVNSYWANECGRCSARLAGRAASADVPPPTETGRVSDLTLAQYAEWAETRATEEKIPVMVNFHLTLASALRELQRLRSSGGAWDKGPPYTSHREALQDIVDAYTARSELFTNDADCAANLADRARHGLRLSSEASELQAENDRLNAALIESMDTNGKLVREITQLRYPGEPSGKPDIARALRYIEGARGFAQKNCPNIMGDLDEIELSLRANSSGEPVAKPDWRPVATAPWDQRNVLCVHAPHGEPFVGYLCMADGGIWKDTRDAYRDPTHWMPLPTPPETKTEKL